MFSFDDCEDDDEHDDDDEQDEDDEDVEEYEDAWEENEVDDESLQIDVTSSFWSFSILRSLQGE